MGRNTLKKHLSKHLHWRLKDITIFSYVTSRHVLFRQGIWQAQDMNIGIPRAPQSNGLWWRLQMERPLAGIEFSVISLCVCVWGGVCVCARALSCLTLCNPLDCNPQGSSVHASFQARILEWVASSFSRGSSWSRNQTCVFCVSCTAGRFFIWCYLFSTLEMDLCINWTSQTI